MKSIEILTNRLANLRDSYNHYTMVDKDKIKAFWIKNDIEEVETLLNELNELKRLKDIEKELGCPLEVVFKKIKESELQYPFSLISICKWNGKWSILEIEQIREDDFACYVKCYLQDYNKTWWLKGEK